jgi:predicted nucleic-acid-binding Zn-ribbon protein
MPDKEGKFSQEERKNIREALQRKGAANAPCPECGHPKFALAEHAVIAVTTPSSILAGGAAYPYILTACLNCGFIKSYLATILGVDLGSFIEKDGDGQS